MQKENFKTCISFSDTFYFNMTITIYYIYSSYEIPSRLSKIQEHFGETNHHEPW